ncbi:MAG TPA: DUF5677 domain-containing protein [Rhizomicrobium sp.]|nr:DUF5677 domain-containing protein [Rhizomicrobium sp.]
MDPEFSRLVNEAVDIATSGRWAAVNARIEALAANPGPDNAWWVQLFASLCSQNFSEYLSLKRDHQSNDIDTPALLAWRARNLLELSVWATYCAKSRENARRVFEDAGRDVRGIYDAFLKWGAATAQPADWLDPLATAKQDLAERAKLLEGIDSLDGPYKQVSEAAKECGLGEHFAVSYKIFSKFAHPTAMRILASPDDARAARQRDWFFSQGCLFFTGAFHALEGQLRA